MREFPSVPEKTAGARPSEKEDVPIGDITEWSSPLWDDFKIKITPTVVIFRGGSPEGRIDGRCFLGLRVTDLVRLGELLRKEAIFSSIPPSDH